MKHNSDIGLRFVTNTDIRISKEFQNELMSELSNIDLSLTQYGEDIWFTDTAVPEHTDTTEYGKDTIVLILTNDADFKVKLSDVYLDAEVGTIIRFDARKPHSVESQEIKIGRFTAMIWDVPRNQSTNEIIEQLRFRINDLNEKSFGYMEIK